MDCFSSAVASALDQPDFAAAGAAPRIGFRPGERVSVDAMPGDRVEIDAHVEEVRIREVEGGILLVDGTGSEILVRATEAGWHRIVVVLRGTAHRLEELVALAFFSFVQAGTGVQVRLDQNGAAAGNTDTLVATIANQVAAQVQAQTNFG